MAEQHRILMPVAACLGFGPGSLLWLQITQDDQAAHLRLGNRVLHHPRTGRRSAHIRCELLHSALGPMHITSQHCPQVPAPLCATWCRPALRNKCRVTDDLVDMSTTPVDAAQGRPEGGMLTDKPCEQTTTAHYDGQLRRAGHCQGTPAQSTTCDNHYSGQALF